MRPDDLALLRTPGPPAVSPDGRMAVVAVDRLDLGADADRSQLWAVPTDASAPARPLTSGARDAAPAFSPDGRWLAYLSAGAGEPPQVHLLPTAGGAPRRLSACPLGAGAPVWAPDSRRLAWTARIPEPGRYGTAEGIGPEAEPPRLITTLRYRVDGVGVVVDRPSQVHVLDLPDDLADDGAPLPAPVQVTRGDLDCTDVCWRPDGGELAFVSARHVRADRDLVTDVFAVRPDGSGLRRITDSRGLCGRPAWSPAGDALFVTAVPDLGPAGVDVAGRARTLCRVDAAGGPLEPLLDPRADHRGDETPGTVVTPAGVLVGVERRGAVELLRVPVAGGAPDVLVDGPFTVRGFGAGGGVVVATVAHDGSAGELLAITPGRRRLLTGFGSRLAATGRVHRARERTATPPEGAAVHGWVTTPPGPGPHPVLLRLHGGPHTQAGWTLLDELQVAVSAGYAVVQCNPRGSSGYGEEHGRAVLGRWGGPDAEDVLAFLDDVLGDPGLRLDAERVGITGAAYGGWLATRLLGRTGRFAAAVVERLPPDPAGDPGPCASAITTPTLVVQPETGPTLPQGTRLYAGLKERGVPTELLLFPGEGHELARSGRPRHRHARLEHLLRWLDRWLREPAEGAAPIGVP